MNNAYFIKFASLILLVLSIVSILNATAQINRQDLISNYAAIADTLNPQDTAYARIICQKLEKTVSQSADSAEMSEAFRVLGIIYGKTGNYDMAFTMLENAVEKAPRKKEEMVFKAKALTSAGMFYQQNGDFGMALNNYLEAEKYYFTVDNIPGLIGIYSALGDLYDKILQPEKRKEINKKAFELSERTRDTTAIIKAYTGMATNLCNDGKFNEALDLYQKAVELSQKTGNKQLEHIAWYDIGFTYSRMKNYTKAGEMYAKSLDVARLSGNRHDIGDALYKMGLMSFYSGNYEKSEKELFEAMEVAHATGSRILERNVYDVLYSLEEARGNYKKAYEYLNNYIDVEYAIFSEDDQKQVNFLKAKFDAEKREFLISKLKSEKEIQQLKLHKQRWLIFGLISALLFTLTMVLFIVKRNRYRQSLAEKQKQLQEQKIIELEKEKQLTATKSVLQGEERERRRIASDLHDGLGGLLSGVKLNLSDMKEKSYLSGEQVSAFGNVISLLDMSIMELKRIAHNMLPETLHNYGLKTAVNDYFLDFPQNDKQKITFGFYGTDRRFSSEMELSIYRIVQELVNNAMKYSEATQINVQLFVEEERIALQVFDNGVGFDSKEVEKNSKGSGLRNIRNRVSAFNGRIEISGNPGEGTEIMIEFDA